MRIVILCLVLSGLANALLFRYCVELGDTCRELEKRNTTLRAQVDESLAMLKRYENEMQFHIQNEFPSYSTREGR